MTKARPDKQTYALSLTEQQSLAGLVAAIEQSLTPIYLMNCRQSRISVNP